MSRGTKIILAAWLAVLALVGGWIIYDSSRGEDGGLLGKMGLSAQIGGPFELVDQDGVKRTDRDFRGKAMLIYFGFTYCPDICPTSLSLMADALEKLGPDADKVWPILITVDPERDTPRALKDYVAQFSPRMIGLTGTPEQIAAVAKAYRVYYAKAPQGSDGSYFMDHTSLFYLVGPDGKFVSHFTTKTRAGDIAAAIKRLPAALQNGK